MYRRKTSKGDGTEYWLCLEDARLKCSARLITKNNQITRYSGTHCHTQNYHPDRYNILDEKEAAEAIKQRERYTVLSGGEIIPEEQNLFSSPEQNLIPEPEIDIVTQQVDPVPSRSVRLTFKP